MLFRSYTPVSRSQIFSLTGEYTTDDICKGVMCEGRESSGRYFRIRREMTASTFGGSPLEDLLLQQQRLPILLFNQFAEGGAYVSKLFAESIIRGLGQYFHTAEVPE